MKCAFFFKFLILFQIYQLGRGHYRKIAYKELPGRMQSFPGTSAVTYCGFVHSHDLKICDHSISMIVSVFSEYDCDLSVHFLGRECWPFA